MEINYVLKLALTLHIVGLAIAGGVSLVNYMSYHRFWVQYASGKTEANMLLEGLIRYPRMIGVGLLISVISGITMMNLAFKGFMDQPWFRVKLSLIVLVIVNTALLYSWTRAIRKNINRDEEAKVMQIRNKVNVSVILQLVFFLIIFILAVFRFN
jgi:uncharacterized membrane protein